MENDENRPSLFELTFETDAKDNPLDSDKEMFKFDIRKQFKK